jgi:hypothetical protein
MGRLKLDNQALKQAMIDLDSSVLTLEGTEKLMILVPTDEEVQIVKSYQGPIEELGKHSISNCSFGWLKDWRDFLLSTAPVERMFLVLAEVPRLKMRLECNLARLTGPSYFDSIKAKLLVLSKAVQEVQTSES